MISIQSDSVNLLIVSRSCPRTALNGCFSFQSGCCGASLPTRSSANIPCAYKGCSVQSVPSWSNVAMRSPGSTYFGLDLAVVSLTNETIACFADPLFHDGKGSPCVCAFAIPNGAATSVNTALRLG